jgi:hypothetical protein
LPFKFKAGIFTLSGLTDSVLLPGCLDYKLYGITQDSVRELVMKLDKQLRNTRLLDWGYVHFDWPYKLVGYYFMALSFIIGDFDYAVALLVPLLLALAIPVYYKL